MWVALEAAGGRAKGGIACVEPAALPAGTVIIADRGEALAPLGRVDSCFVKCVQEAVMHLVTGWVISAFG